MFKPKMANVIKGAVTQATAVWRQPVQHVDSPKASPVRTLGGPKAFNSPLIKRYIK